MARPLRIEYPGAFYHVTSRGNERKAIFSQDKDRENFLGYLNEAHRRFNLVIHAYCLMPNHYHLVCETPLANLSRCMQFINSSYTAYYNARCKRTGHLLQGRYKAILVDKDSYITALVRYVHLNPVRANLANMPEEYRWSSYRYFVISRKGRPDFLTTDFAMSYFDQDVGGFRQFTEEAVSKKTETPFGDLKAGFILGDDSFVKHIKDRYLGNIEASRDLPSLRQLKKNCVLSEKIVGIIDSEIGLSDKERVKLKVYFLRKYTGDTLSKVAQAASHRRLSISAVSQIVSRLVKERKENSKTEKTIRKIEGKILNV
ncbi:MAG: transposase [Candidatus Omnitrophica bacterium]|nr:transposase [Candidatus Omnitrophota bacterium]